MSAVPFRKENRGGARAGAGRKPEALSATLVRKMINVANQYAKKHGKTMDMVLAEFIYDEELPTRDRMLAIKLYKDKTMAPISEGGPTDTELGPTVYLPELKPDPGKVVPIDRSVETTSG
jgi:hypothetical protein